jgi:hypothetical protein
MVAPIGGINDRMKTLMAENFVTAGYEISGEWVEFQDDTVDWSPFAQKINANEDADCVFWLHAQTFHLGNMLKSLREIGYDKFVLVGSNPGGPGTVEIAGNAATNCLTQTHLPNGLGNPPELDEFLSRYMAIYGEDIDLCIEGCNMLYVLAPIIEKAQSLDTDVIKATWEGMDGQTVPTLYGPSVISGTETYGIKGHVLSNPWPGMLFDNGEYYSVGWFDPGPLP